MTKRARVVLLASLTTVSLARAEPAGAAPPTKEECVEAHGRGQDLRDKGQVSEAKRLLLLCAQASCPALVQSDCAKLGEELARTVPTISFSARDAKGNDLFDTQVFVDGVLFTSRLDDGRAFDIDPGKHTIRFVHGGKEESMTVVVTAGEKGRNVAVTFGAADGAAPGGASGTVTSEPEGPSRPVLPLVVAGIGGAALATGVVLTVVGLGNVPDACDRSANECAAAPGSPVFGEASDAVGLANIGLGVAAGGLALGIGGLVWYFASSPSEKGSTAAFVPWTDGRGQAGASYRLRF